MHEDELPEGLQDYLDSMVPGADERLARQMREIVQVDQRTQPGKKLIVEVINQMIEEFYAKRQAVPNPYTGQFSPKRWQCQRTIYYPAPPPDNSRMCQWLNFETQSFCGKCGGPKPSTLLTPS